MSIHRCKHCNRTPVERPADVIDDCMCVYYRCQCGATGPWRRTREEAIAQWNRIHGADKPQPTRAMSALARMKAAFWAAY